MADYIPAPDVEFDDWQLNFINFLVSNGAALGFAPAEITALQALQTGWANDYQNHKDAATAALAAREQKDAGRFDYEAELRSAAQRAQNSPALTDKLRKEAGLPVYDTSRTRADAPQSRPVLVVDTSRRLEHVVAFADAATPTSRKKPGGVAGINIYLQIGGETPPDVNKMQLVGFDTATPYLYQFNAADAGKSAWWAARWVNSRQQPGPWSETVMATITG